MKRDDAGWRVIDIELTRGALGQRMDKALLSDVDPAIGLSRSRLQLALAAGRVQFVDAAGERTLRDASAKVKRLGRARIALPAPEPAVPEPEAMALEVVFEDAALLVVVKPVGVATHPAPGSERGTLVNGLLHHIGADLPRRADGSGDPDVSDGGFDIGGVARPGVVHRLDKGTSGLLVVAKTDAALWGLARQFAAHSVMREYRALVWGAPDRGDPRLAGLATVSFEADALRIDAPLGRHARDRKKMAVRSDGRRAVTRAYLRETFGPEGRPVAARVACRLETGRTHQIRAHFAHIGHPLIGDPVYGRPRKVPLGLADAAGRARVDAFAPQALHAETLGFIHPVSGAALRFEAPPPAAFRDLEAALSAL